MSDNKDGMQEWLSFLNSKTSDLKKEKSQTTWNGRYLNQTTLYGVKIDNQENDIKSQFSLKSLCAPKGILFIGCIGYEQYNEANAEQSVYVSSFEALLELLRQVKNCFDVIVISPISGFAQSNENPLNLLEQLNDFILMIKGVSPVIVVEHTLSGKSDLSYGFNSVVQNILFE